MRQADTPHIGAATYQQALEGRPLNRFQIGLVLVVLLVLIIDGIDIQLLALVSPAILENWGIDRAALGPALAAALFGMALGASMGGWLGDRLGRRNTLIASILLFGLATMAAALTTNVPGMATLRVLSGFGFGAAGPCGLALVTEWLPQRARLQVIALLAIGTPAGGMVGAILVGLFLPLYGWPGAFLICGAFTVVVALLCALVVRESPVYLVARGRPDSAERAARRVIDADVALRFEASPASTAGTGAMAGDRLFDRSNRRLAAGASLSFFCAAAVAYAFQSWTPVLLTGSGFSKTQALSASFVFNMLSSLGALAAGLANQWFGSKAALRLSAVLAFACVAGLALVVESLSGPPSLGTQILVDILVGGAGGFASLAIATVYTIMAVGFAPACRASGIGLGMMMGRFGGIATSFAGGYLLDLGHGSFWPFFAALALSAGLVCLGSFVADRHVAPLRKG